MGRVFNGRREVMVNIVFNKMKFIEKKKLPIKDQLSKDKEIINLGIY